MVRWWWVGLPLAGCVGDYGLAKHDGTLLVQPARLDFGTLQEGEVAVEAVHVSNVGNGPLWVDEIRVEGGAFTFVEDPALGELAGGATRLVDVVYTPIDPVADAGRVWVRTDAGEESEVELRGRLLPALEDPGEEVEEDSAAIEVTLAEGEVATLAVQFTVSGGLDVAFLLDTTRSMDSLVDSVKEEFDGLAQDLDERYVDAGYGLATFDDYAEYPYGSLGVDMPFLLRVPITDDRAAIQAGLAASDIHEGQDAPESSMEALVQALTGRGYDMNCDRILDATTDVPPYHPMPNDAFGGGVAGHGGDGSGGLGLREGRLPVIVYATNYELRDAEDTRYTTPGGCNDAGFSDVVAAAADSGAKLIGIAVEMSDASHAFGQMLALGEATGSMADLDGNGTLEPAAIAWNDEVSIRGTIGDAIDQLVGAMEWQMVWLEVEDPYGIVQDIAPRVLTDVHSGETLTFQITLQGVPLTEPVPLVFDLMGDGGILLATQSIVVSPPE